MERQLAQAGSAGLLALPRPVFAHAAGSGNATASVLLAVPG